MKNLRQSGEENSPRAKDSSKALADNSHSFPENHHKIYLYGSQSRNEAKETSDIDLLVFCKEISKEIRQKLKNLSEKYQVDINHQYCTYECLDNSHLVFWRTVRKDAKPIVKFI